jgi:hypothetical protein
VELTLHRTPYIFEYYPLCHFLRRNLGTLLLESISEELGLTVTVKTSSRV